jgi:hypothetical protein
VEIRLALNLLHGTGWPQTHDPPPSAPECWDYRHELPHLALYYMFYHYFRVYSYLLAKTLLSNSMPCYAAVVSLSSSHVYLQCLLMLNLISFCSAGPRSNRPYRARAMWPGCTVGYPT